MTSLIPAGVAAYTKAKCAAVVSLFPKITHVYGYAAAPSDHQNGRCIDYMIMNKALTRAEQVALGDAIAAWHWTNRHRVGLVLVIWNRRILRTYGKTQGGKFYPAGTWAPYNSSINAYWTNPHTDHPHVEYDGSAMTLPTPTPTPTLPWSGKAEDFPGVAAFQLGQDHPAVTMLDRQLIAWGFTASNDGDGYQAGPTFTQHTLDNVKDAQREFGWTGAGADGYPGPETWRRLMAAPAEKAAREGKTVGNETTLQRTFTVAGGNVLRRTDSLVGRLKWALRVGNIAKAFLSVNPDVIIACELDKTSAASLGAKLGSGWTWWRLGTGYGPLAVYWREGGRFARQSGATNQAGLGENRWLLSLPLVHTATGQLVTFDAAHLENDGDPTTDGHTARFGESSSMAKLTSHGARVFYADLNSTTPSTAKATARQRQKPRPVLRAAGWAGFLTEAVKLVYATRHGGKGAKPNGAAIDELGWRGALTFVTGGLIDTAKTRCSDHHFLWGRFKIN